MDVSAIAQKAVKHARKLGADGAEAYVLKQKGIVVQIERNAVSNESIQEIGGIGIRVLKNQAFGFSHIDKLDEKKVEQAVEGAYHIANASIADPNNALPSKKPLPRVAGIYDKKIVDLQVEDAVEMSKSMLEAALHYDKRVRVDSGGIETRFEEEALVNTEGVDAREERTFMGVFIWGLARENGEVTSFTEDYGYSHKPDLDVEEIGTSFAERAVKQFGAKKIESFEGTVVLDFAPAAELVSGSLIFGVRSDNILRNASPLKEKIGSELAVPQLNIVDDGLLEAGMMTKAFDDEGCPRKRTPILEKGILKNFLFDTYNSKKGKTESTGNASRRRMGLFFTPFLPFETPPQLLTTNLIIEPGNLTKEQLIAETDKGVFAGRFSGNVELSNGNFSGIVKQGFLIEEGELKHPITETMISGNSYALMKNISGISRDLKIVEVAGVSPSALSPMMKVEKVKVTGKA
jgi:PmbA protein